MQLDGLIFLAHAVQTIGQLIFVALLFGSKAKEMLGVKCTGPSY